MSNRILAGAAVILSDLALFLAVAREKFDYCIDFTRNDRSAFLSFLLSGAAEKTHYVLAGTRARPKARARVL